MIRKTVLALIVIGAVFAGIMIERHYFDVPSLEGEGTKTNGPTAVIAPGKIEPFGGIYNVFAPQGQIVTRYNENHEGTVISSGVKVQIGTELAQLAGQELLKQQVRLADAKMADAKKQIEAQIATAKLQVRAAGLALHEAEFNLAQVQANKDQTVNEKKLDNAKKELAQLEKFAQDEDTKRLVSQQQVLDQALEVENAEFEFQKGLKQLPRLEKSAQFAVEMAQENVDDARKALKEAEKLQENPPRALKEAKALALIQSNLSKIKAPCAGMILKVFVKEGESVINTPLLQIGNLDRMQCVAAVSDRKIGQLKVNGEATIKSAAFGERELRGKIVEIGRMVGTSSQPMSNPLALVDQRTVDVVIEIDKDDVELAARFVNLRVEVVIPPPSTPARPKSSSNSVSSR